MAQTFVKAIPRARAIAPGFFFWSPINPGGLEEACFYLRILNPGITTVLISFDGVTPHDYIRPGFELLLETQVSPQPKASEALFAKGTIVYALTAVMGAGPIYMSGYYV